jgi:uncharacterized membrane protein
LKREITQAIIEGVTIAMGYVFAVTLFGLPCFDHHTTSFIAGGTLL